MHQNQPEFQIPGLQGMVDRIRLEADRLENNALIDEVTELPNRRYFNEVLKRELAETKRYKHQLTVLYIDFNDLKVINDSYGHEFGDQALREVGQRIRGSKSRTSDFVARIGGDEFAMILPETDGDKAVEAAKRFLKIMAEKPISIKGKECTVQLAVGVGEFSAGMSANALLAQADRLMYIAKAKKKTGSWIGYENDGQVELVTAAGR